MRNPSFLYLLQLGPRLLAVWPRRRCLPQQAITLLLHRCSEDLHLHYVMSKKRIGKEASRMCSSFITSAITKFTAAVRLLGNVNCWSRVLSDGSVRF
ncbi:MAG: hypothetical protein ETSY1_19685 [Candidatus Entotheonella factor]|uniref:Uncharacterized protein n=1 Tax=Entotheonella factor TaxID=1429438 RepID=W4LKI7_ENTF1|nr:MAG: hypothetical protein ETSY1_19685 [Candidatus Entotheonella factor]